MQTGRRYLHIERVEAAWDAWETYDQFDDDPTFMGQDLRWEALSAAIKHAQGVERLLAGRRLPSGEKRGHTPGFPTWLLPLPSARP